ncbi:MAG: F0F1 ATP synthase subunit A [Planctomycetota bacterium]|nr:F0F1 ATP synthase subunit A [Planctomycetota bacterium]
MFLAAGDNFNPVEHLYDRASTWVSLWNVHGKEFIESWNTNMPGFMALSQHVIMMWVAAAICILGFSYVTFARNSRVPKGLRNFLEPIVTFVRDEVVRPSISNPHFKTHGHGEHGHEHHEHKEGEHHDHLPQYWLADKLVPFLCCLFFFIATVNLLGLIPGSTTASSQITFTASMALLVLLTYLIGSVIISVKVEGGVGAGLKAWLFNLVPVHFSTKPMDLIVWLLLLLIEVVGLFMKPVALAIRLFANMTAGHCLVLSLLFLNLLIPSGSEVWRIGTGIPTVLMTVAIYGLEIFVAILQAYIFTYLSAIFIGQYLVPEH